jgi:hypothetical protein
MVNAVAGFAAEIACRHHLLEQWPGPVFRVGELVVNCLHDCEQYDANASLPSARALPGYPSSQ